MFKWISSDWPDDLGTIYNNILWENNKLTNELLGDNCKTGDYLHYINTRC